MTAGPVVRRADDDTQPIPVVASRGRHAAPRPKRSAGAWALIAAREAGIVLGLAVSALLLLRLLAGQVAYVADDAMEPTVSSGDRVIITPWGQPRQGEVVLVRSPAAWGSPDGTAVVRVVAVGGQRVTCCDGDGRVRVDGTPLDEPYVAGPTDQVEFDVTVPDGRIFVLADRRTTARDSRAILDERSGSLALDDVLGRVVVVAWPPRGPVS